MNDDSGGDSTHINTFAPFTPSHNSFACAGAVALHRCVGHTALLCNIDRKPTNDSLLPVLGHSSGRVVEDAMLRCNSSRASSMRPRVEMVDVNRARIGSFE